VIDARRRGEIFGELRLREVLSGVGGRGAEAVAAAVEDAVLDFQGGPLRDDLAVLVVEATGPAPISEQDDDER
jgi:hypothetical protein